MKIASYCLSFILAVACIFLVIELGSKTFLPDSYQGYLIKEANDQVKWRLNPFEPSKPTNAFRQPVSIKKPEDTFRIVSLGASATEGWLSAEAVFNTYGEKWDPKNASSYSRVIEYILNTIATPGSKHVEVINLGIAAYNMTDVHRMLKDSDVLEPDLLLIQLGSNETWTSKRQNWLANFDLDIPYLYSENAYDVYSETKAGWRTLAKNGNAFSPLALFASQNKPIAKESPDRLAGLNQRLDSYRLELDRLGNYIARKQIPTIFLLPSQNIADFEPFGSMSRADIDEATLAQLNELLIKAAAESGETAKELYMEILNIDDGVAEANFQLGRIYLEEQKTELARKYLWKANDRDLVLKRIPSSFHKIGHEFLEHQNFTFLDEMDFFESKSKLGAVGYNWLSDDVHPNRAGQFELGKRIVEIILQRNLLPADVYAADLNRMPEITAYNKYTGFDQKSASTMLYLKAAHNYLAFGRFIKRIQWHPKPETFLAPILADLAIANEYAPSDNSLILGAALNLYSGKLNVARDYIKNLQCSESAQRGSQIHSTLLQTLRRVTANTKQHLENDLNSILIAEGCTP